MKIHVDKSVLGGQPVPAAIYRVRITNTKGGASREKKIPMLNIEHTILSEGPDPNVKTQGRKVFTNILFNEDALWKVNQYHQAASGSDIPDGDYTADELMNRVSSAVRGQEMMAEVGVEEYPENSGQMRNRVQKVFALKQ